MWCVYCFHKWRDRIAVGLVAFFCVAFVGEAAFHAADSIAASATAPTTSAAPTVDAAVVPIVMYHGLLPEKARQGTYVIAPSLFESDLQYIQRAGYTPILMRDLLAYVEQGKPLPEKPIILTFDDGYYNNYAYAYPLLQKYGMKAVISAIARWSQFYSDTPAEANRPLYSHITWDQMREMTDSGLVEMQNHSYDLHHADGGRKGASRLRTESVAAYQTLLEEDLTTAQRLFADKAGITPTTFAYPFGAMSPEAVPVLQKLGFRATLTSESRVNVVRPQDSLYGLGRYLRPNGVDSRTYFDKIFRACDATRAQQNKE
ncbi:MAG: polysaccharide deacetylase family protein [Clostridia bacterium]|nr:polysaccharide deacetylase family protein [Loktanella sp.]MBQ1950128.1 polysaccharide deacetylase family protein [Clostridia bacterium]